MHLRLASHGGRPSPGPRPDSASGSDGRHRLAAAPPSSSWSCCTVQVGIGGTGVVGMLSNGGGPTVLLRADMDALPVKEDTGADYASTATARTPTATRYR
jgi:hypothetical protein